MFSGVKKDCNLKDDISRGICKGKDDRGIWGSRPCGSSTQILPAGRTSHIPQSLGAKLRTLKNNQNIKDERNA